MLVCSRGSSRLFDDIFLGILGIPCRSSDDYLCNLHICRGFESLCMSSFCEGWHICHRWWYPQCSRDVRDRIVDNTYIGWVPCWVFWGQCVC